MSAVSRETPACRDADPAAFIPDNDARPDLEWLALTAALFCARCPVRAACARAADRRLEHGLWAGAYRVRGNDYRWTLFPGGVRPAVGREHRRSGPAPRRAAS